MTQLSALTLPLLHRPAVQHVGTLNPEHLRQRGSRHGESFEGHHLSVSVHPDAWRKIAKLGDAPTWTLTRTDGRPGVFIDARLAERSETVTRALLLWGEANGLVQQQVRWEAWTLDDDGDWGYSLHRTAGSACVQCDPADQERSDEDDEALTQLLDTLGNSPGDEKLQQLKVLLPGGPDDAGLVVRVTVPIGTPELEDVTGMGQGDRDATTALLTRWAELHGEDTFGKPIDGLWWADTLNVWSLSAPRGLIFQERVPAWRKAQDRP